MSWLGSQPLASPAFAIATMAMLLAAVGARQIAVLRRCWVAGCAIADATVAFSRAGNGPRVLVIGDSTGVGTGAERPEDSLAGQLAHDFPAATVINRARNGARTREAIEQLRSQDPGPYALLLIHVGGNDLLRRTPLSRLATQIEELVREAVRRSPNVVITTTPNVGLAPAFVAPLSWWVSARSRRIRDLFADAARRHGATYVDFFFPRGRCPFGREPRRYYSVDGLHPSTDCYRLVYRTIKKRAPLAIALGASGACPGEEDCAVS